MFKLSRNIIDQYQPNTALPSLNFKVSLKDNRELTDLELHFNGTNEPMGLVISGYELEQIQDTTSKWHNKKIISNIMSFKILPELF